MKTKLDILYEDNHIIVVVKPENVLSQSDNTKDEDMLSILKEYIKEKYNKPGNVYLGLVHRLDRPTKGIMVFAKTSKAAERLSKQIKDKETFIKKYYAIVDGILNDKSGLLENYLLKTEDNSTIVTDKKNGKYASLFYKVISEKNNLTLVDILLNTGRHHQIRIQFKNINHPVFGDQRYGIQNKKQLALFAYYLSFIHPVTKEKMEFKIFPKGDIWNLFKEDLC